MTGIPTSASWIICDQLGALDPTLEQCVDEDDVGSKLLDRRQDPAPIGQDVEQLDPRLRVEQATDVLGDLRDVFDDEEACLVTRWHPPDDTTRVGGATRARRSRSAVTRLRGPVRA